MRLLYTASCTESSWPAGLTQTAQTRCEPSAWRRRRAGCTCRRRAHLSRRRLPGPCRGGPGRPGRRRARSG